MAWVRRDGEKAEFQATTRLSSKPHWGHIFSGVTYQPTNPITKVSNNNNCSHQDSTESLADRAVFSHVERQLHTGRISGTFEGFFRQLNSPLKGMAQYFLVPMNPFLSEKTFYQKKLSIRKILHPSPVLTLGLARIQRSLRGYCDTHYLSLMWLWHVYGLK